MNLDLLKSDLLKNSDLHLAIFLMIGVCGAILIAVHIKNRDQRLSDPELIKQIESQFENDLRKIDPPPRTAVNKVENRTKHGVVVGINATYRSELRPNEFLESLRGELEKNDWVHVENERFCKGEFDAQLMRESRGGMRESGEYYQLSMSFGLRDAVHFGNVLPEQCR